MWLNASVYSDVHIEGNALIERLRTMRTHVFLSVAMDFQVTTQIAFVVENLSTLWAFGCKFFCASVNGQMVLVIT